MLNLFLLFLSFKVSKYIKKGCVCVYFSQSFLVLAIYDDRGQKMIEINKNTEKYRFLFRLSGMPVSLRIYVTHCRKDNYKVIMLI